jgi:MoaA/NifB/PqqE/SkfB family radical SAM enzyme
MMLKLNQITCLHVELTTKCNARCPMCPRNYRGMDFNSGYPEVELDLDKFKQIFKPDFLKQIKLIKFNGNLGDCSLASDLPDILEYIYESSESSVNLTTNASTRTPEWWANLANPRLTIVFDLDGLEDTHSLYRLDTNWNKIVRNACAFIQNGGSAVWKMIIFDHNRHQLKECESLSKELGFKGFWPVDQGRSQGPVFDRHGKLSHWLGDNDGSEPQPHEMLESHLTWFDSKPSSEWGLGNKEKCSINCQHIKNKELYVAADGSVYPCCFLGFFPGKMNHPGNSQLVKIVKENNALEHDLEHCIQWFNQVEESWKLESVDQGKIYGCIISCGVTQ